MRTFTLASIALTGLVVSVSGCAYYVPVQQPALARLTPEQFAAINSNDRLTPEQKQRLTEQNQQVLNDQDAAQQSAQTVFVGPVYPAYTYPGYYYPYAYPAYSPFYAPGISLSLGYIWGRSAGPYRGGWHGHGHR